MASVVPPIPHHPEETGIAPSILHDLVLRRTLYDGQSSTLQLSQELRLSPPLVEILIDELRALHLVEIQGLERRNYLLTLTHHGQEQAHERMEVSRYAGPAPVGLDDYTAVTVAEVARTDIDAPRMRQAFADLVISEPLLDELGPAFRARGAMFVYGPPGTGKSAIAERLDRAYDDTVAVPHAIEVDGQIITVFDPLVHEPVEGAPGGEDPRWVRCRRPCIIVGGELTAGQLDLQWEGGSGTYRAPLQLQANGGILVIDDFGRQALTPEALLNRWIVPLDRGIDHLNLTHGTKLVVPFTPKIVFSTNLDLRTLGDEAFFRRMRSKVLIPPIGDEQFDEVLHRVIDGRGITLVDGAAAYLRQVARAKGDGDLRPYLPGAVCDLVESICDYAHRPRVLDHDMVDRVALLYFTHARDDDAPSDRKGSTLHQGT